MSHKLFINKNSKLIVGLALIGMIMGSCSSLKQTGDSNQQDPYAGTDTSLRELSQDKEIEYKYKFIEATKLRLLGNTSDALEYLYQCSRIQPHAPGPYYQMSLIANQIDEKKEAVKYGKKAVLYGPDNKWYRLNLANLYLQQNTLDSALNQYQYLVEDIGVRDMDIVFRLAQLFQRNERYREALKYYNQIEERMGFNEQITILKKMIYTRLGEKDQAYRQVEKLIDRFPDEARYYGMLAELYATFQEYDKADKMYDKLFSIDSTNNLGQLSLVKYYHQQEEYGKSLDLLTKKVIPNESVDFRDKMMMLMEYLSDNKKLQKYSYEIGSALDAFEKHHPERSEVHALFADYHLKQNEFRQSIRHLKMLAEGQSSKYIYWDQLLSVYSITSRFRDMYKEGLVAIENYPQKPRLYLLTGIGAQQINKTDTAIILLDKGLTYIEDDQDMRIQFYTQLAEAHYQKKHYEMAWDFFEQVIRLDPDNAMVLNNYSYYLSLRGINLEKALRYSRKVVDQEPENAIYLDTYAWILYKKGDIDQAKKYIEKSIRHGGYDDADIVEHYGDILFKSGKVTEAVDQWKKSKSLGNQSENLEYKINRKKLPPDTHED